MPASLSTRRTLAVALAALAAGGGLAACGSSDDDTGGNAATTSGSAAAGGTAATATAPRTTTAGTETGAVAGVATTHLSIDAVERSADQLAWSRRDLTSKAGDVTIALANPAGNQLPHAVEIQGGGVEQESQIVQPGDKTSVTAQLRPGRYTFYCPVGNHRELGMEGTLTVR